MPLLPLSAAAFNVTSSWLNVSDRLDAVISCSDGSPDDSGLGGEDQQGEGAEEEHGLDHGDGGGDDGAGCRRAQETLPELSSLGIFIERWPGPCLSPAPPAADISPEYTAVLGHGAIADMDCVT